MVLPVHEDGPDQAEFDQMIANLQRATNFLKALAHEGRLTILYHLASGERSVSELENLLSQRQPAVSQQLARLRREGLVNTRRDGKVVYYRLADRRARPVLELVYEMFRADKAPKS